MLQRKYSRIIERFAKQQNVSLGEALDFFYRSETYQLIRDGISDMHCMSDAYLAEELQMEMAKKKKESSPINVIKLSENFCKTPRTEVKRFWYGVFFFMPYYRSLA